MTDFTQRINYRRALEGELERTIGKMRGVEAAQVHLAMQEGSVFRAPDKPLEASVVIKLANGDTPAPDVVSGISHLVASSVDGLQSEHVTIVDDGGRMLTMDSDISSAAGLTSRQLGVQREVESYLEKKAQTIVGQIVGGKNARVQVSAAINFDQVQRTTSAVDPDKQAIATEQRAEITPGAQGGAASSNVATSYETTKSTETFSGAIGNVKRLTVAVLINDRQLQGTRPSSAPRTAEEMSRIDELVRNAVGIDSARGDKLSVVNAAFDVAPPLVADSAITPDIWTRLDHAQRPIATAIGLVALIFVAVLTVRALRPTRSPGRLEAGATVPALASGEMHGHDESMGMAGTHAATQRHLPHVEHDGPQILIAGPESSGETLVLREMANPVRDQVVAIIEQRPEAATRVVRSWLKQD
jgi:flagellar M-ring protein FliF